MTEAIHRFDCFGARCSVLVTGGGAEPAARLVKRRLLRWHGRFSRFEPGSELSRLNANPRARVTVSGTMARLATAAVWAAEETGGLVDSTLVGEIESVGYVSDLGEPLPLEHAFRLAPERRPATSRGEQWWRAVRVAEEGLSLERPVGLRLDSGGLAKGLFADLAADSLESFESYAIDCGGDLRLGGISGALRAVSVTSPFDGVTVLHTFERSGGGVATSGIGRRSWLDESGAPAHHLLDPGSGRPAFTGIVQATALAPTALAAETLAKAAVLSGPEGARGWLRHGGLVVYEDGSHELVKAAS